MFADKIKNIIVETDLMKKKVSRGALIGLNTALLYAQSERIAGVACDLPFVTGDLMTRLVKPIPGLPLPAEALDNVSVRIPVRAT